MKEGSRSGLALHGSLWEERDNRETLSVSFFGDIEFLAASVSPARDYIKHFAKVRTGPPRRPKQKKD